MRRTSIAALLPSRKKPYVAGRHGTMSKSATPTSFALRDPPVWHRPPTKTALALVPAYESGALLGTTLARASRFLTEDDRALVALRSRCEAFKMTWFLASLPNTVQPAARR
jgi:hypothetical protein